MVILHQLKSAIFLELIISKNEGKNSESDVCTLHTFRRTAVFHARVMIEEVVIISIAASVEELFTLHGGHVEKIAPGNAKA